MRDEDALQVNRLSRTWGCVEEKCSEPAPASELLYAVRKSNNHILLLRIDDPKFLNQYPWIHCLTERVHLAHKGAIRFPNLLQENATTLLSDPSLDLDRFLFLSPFAGRNFNATGDNLVDAWRLEVCQRLAKELHAWSESGKLFGDLGLGTCFAEPPRNGICFGQNEWTKEISESAEGWDPNARIERGLQLLALCSKMPRDQRPLDEIKRLAEWMNKLASDTRVANASQDIVWANAFTFNNQSLGVRTPGGAVRSLTEQEIASGLIRWLAQLQTGDMMSPIEVANVFLTDSTNPKQRDPLAWVVEKDRDPAKLDRLRKALPDTLTNLMANSPNLRNQENDRCIVRLSYTNNTGKASAPERTIVTAMLRLEPTGWRIAKVTCGTEIIDFENPE
jgi:hypothetical protein